MKTRGYGRTVLGTGVKGRKWIYHHEFEHRGSGVVAIYSYGPADEHDALVRESRNVMRARFGVAQAVTSGVVSYPGPVAETQTVFCIDAAGGPDRPKMRQASPVQADWHVSYTVDTGQGCLADGAVELYFTGPLDDADLWRMWVDRVVCEALADDRHGPRRATVRNLEVRAVPEGRYWFLADDGPVAEMSRFEVCI
jgi:hypothetical protein